MSNLLMRGKLQSTLYYQLCVCIIIIASAHHSTYHNWKQLCIWLPLILCMYTHIHSHLWDELVNQIAQLDNPSRKLKAGSIGFEMQKQRKAFQLDKSFDTSCDLARCFSFLRQPKKTLDLQFAERAGFKMMPNFFFPAVPKVLEDFWVALELIIVLFDFIFNCVVFSGESLDTLVVSFSVVAVILALLDTLLYFTNESSCKRYSKLFRKRHKHNSPLGTDNEDSKSCSKCPKIPESCTKKMGIWTQIIRTLISELILFPLTLADVVELIELRAYAENDAENRINFGLFIVGILFLVVTVYFMRIFMALSSIANVKRLTKTTTDDPTVLIVKFCVHLIGQIVMHAIVVIMISSKFHQGTCIDDIESGENVSVTISPFLWYEIGSGALIPLVGTILFFLLNYPAIKHLSIVMYIDIMTAVVNESFADLIFQGEGLKTAKKKATKVAEKASIKTTRAHFEEYKKRFSFKNRLQYRLTNPFVIICSLLYGYAFIGFFVSHCFGYRDPCDREGGFQFLLGNDVFVTVTFVVGILVSVIANYQLLVAILSLMLVGILATLLSPVLLISLIFLFLTWFSNRHLNRYRKNTT